jgi:hypothetical protein
MKWYLTSLSKVFPATEARSTRYVFQLENVIQDIASWPLHVSMFFMCSLVLGLIANVSDSFAPHRTFFQTFYFKLLQFDEFSYSWDTQSARGTLSLIT